MTNGERLLVLRRSCAGQWLTAGRTEKCGGTLCSLGDVGELCVGKNYNS